MEIAARDAAPADLDAIASLAESGILELTDNRGGTVWRRDVARPVPSRPSLERDLGDEDTAVVVGTIDGVPVGYGVAHIDVLTDGGRVARITDLFTLEDARGVGVGEAVMNHLVGWARAHGCFGVDSLALPGDRHTKNFFESFGLVARAIVVHRSLEP